MRLPQRKYVLALIMAGIILLTAVQWIAFEKTQERVLSLLCNTSPAPYTLEVETFLPPEELIDEAVGYRYHDGEIEIVIPGKHGNVSLWYETLSWKLSWELNTSVSDLRGYLANGSDEEVEMMFQIVKRVYLMSQFKEGLCQKNLTAVIFRPAPPFKWFLSLRHAAEELTKYRDFKMMLIMAVTFCFIGVFWLWFSLVSRLPLKGLPRIAAALLLIGVLFGSFIYALELILPDGESEHLQGPSHHECGAFQLNDCYAELFYAALDYMGENRETTTCETLTYLEKHLREDEMERLTRVLEPNCP